MLQIVKSILGSTDEDKALVVSNILEEIQNDLNPQESKVFKFLKFGYDTYHQFQTEELFLQQFPEFKASLAEIQPLNQESLDYYRREFIEKHKRLTLSKKLLNMATTLQSTGLTPEMVETLRDSTKANNDEDDILKKADVLDLYEDAKQKGSHGIKTYVPEIDQLIGNIEPGTLSVIAGYSGHGKTSWALNMAYKGAKEGLHIVYISLEIAENILLYDFISLHSTDPKFGVEPISQADIRTRKLNKTQEEDFKKVAEDFNKNILPNIHILTERNFKEFSYGEVRDILYRIDSQHKIDVVFVDHANLLKYYVKGKFNNTGDAINEYVSFFRQMAICFKKEDGKDRQISVILLAQCNRTGMLKAKAAGKGKGKDPNMEGKYDTTALSEAHELERASSYVMMVYSSEEMRLGNEARVQLIKSRFGETHEDPIAVSFLPKFYQFGEMTSDVTSNSVSNFSNVSSFDDLLGMNPMSEGFSYSKVDFSDL